MSFQSENDELLKFLLNERFFKVWQSPDHSETSLWQTAQMELFLTNQCNQNCAYCYLHENENLYPSSATKPEKILENLPLICQWIYDNNYDISNIALFGGEIWHTSLGLDVLDILKMWLKKGMKVRNFTLPTNGSFLLDANTTQIIQNYIDDFSELGSYLDISLSIDGKVIDNLERPRKDKCLYSDKFYDAAFTFAYHNKIGFHPMVAAPTAKYWQENFKWWKQKCEEYNMNPYEAVMMLEVRNDDWNDETRAEYANFLHYLLEDFYKNSPYNNPKDFSALLCGHPAQNEQFNYLPFLLTPPVDAFTCTLPLQLCIRVGDLAIAPCHRLAYEHLLYGYFVKDNTTNQIVDIKENNLYMAERCLYISNSAATPGCDACAYNKLCLRGCGGSQYENTGDPFFPVKGVCALEKEKINIIIKFYQSHGIIDVLENIPVEHPDYHSAYAILEPIYAIQETQSN